MILVPLTAAELAARTDIESRDDVELLVRSFYRYAAMDELLGPIFMAADLDWPFHIAKLTDFWSWQLLGQRGYEGNPLRAHEPANERTPFRGEHFERWLDLFTSTVDEYFVGPTADLAKARADKMAGALQRLLAGAHGPGDVGVEPMLPARIP